MQTLGLHSDQCRSHEWDARLRYVGIGVRQLLHSTIRFTQSKTRKSKDQNMAQLKQVIH